MQVRLIADQRKKVPKFRGLYHAATTILREEVRKVLKDFNIFLLITVGCFWYVPRAGSDDHEARLQPGHQILRHGVTEEHLHWWRHDRSCTILRGGIVWCYSR